MNNQEIKKDAGKPQLTLVPTQIIEDIAYVRMYGVNKYGKKESWKEVEIERYRNALFRHLLAYLNDPLGVDEESGLPHLSHVACNVAFLCELEKLSNQKSEPEPQNLSGWVRCSDRLPGNNVAVDVRCQDLETGGLLPIVTGYFDYVRGKWYLDGDDIDTNIDFNVIEWHEK